MKLSTDCQPIVMHTLRIVIIGRLVFAFLTSNPPIFRVPPFKSDHFARGAAEIIFLMMFLMRFLMTFLMLFLMIFLVIFLTIFHSR